MRASMTKAAKLPPPDLALITDPPRQAIGAVRVSTEAQSEKYGPARQKTDIEREAREHDLQIVGWIEEHISGTDLDRAAQNAYDDLARKYKGLNFIFADTNRVGRWVEVTVGIARRLLKQHGAGVYVTSVGDLRRPRNWKAFLDDAVDAEKDHAKIVHNLSTGKFDKARKGLWPQGAPPYGYRLERDEKGVSLRPVPHPTTSLVYARMVDLAMSGLGSQAIADTLNEDGTSEPRQGGLRQARGWSNTQVLRILRNPAYTGRLEYHGPEGEMAVVTFEPLITPARWRTLQDAITDRKLHRLTPLPTGLLSGFARCAECGASININRQSKRTNSARYICRRHGLASAQRRRGIEPCGMKGRLKIEETDEQAWGFFVQRMSDPVFLARAHARDRAPTVPNHGPRLEELRGLIEGAVRRAALLNLDDDTLAGIVRPWQEEVKRLQAEMTPAPVEPAPDMTGLAAFLAEHLPTVTGLSERREALRVWRTVVLVGPKGVEDVIVRVAKVE